MSSTDQATTQENAEAIVIDFFQDIACPWCRIGKQHLTDALARWDGPAPLVRYHPYLLDESIPAEGRDYRAHLAARKGGEAHLDTIFERVIRAGEAAGLTFRFDNMTVAANTINAHRLIAISPADRREAVVDALHRAYFEEGRNIGDLAVLAEIAGEAGLDRERVAEILDSDAAREDVVAAAHQARQTGINGVPFFIFNNALAVYGAHPAETLLAVLNEATQTGGQPDDAVAES